MKDNLEKIFDFLKQIEKLKSTLRYNKTTGGRNESTADHSWRLALMVPVIAGELEVDIDIEKSMKIALVHDLAESITGDIDAIKISTGEVSKDEKKKQELEAMDKIKNLLPDKMGKDVYGLWQEYETVSTKEGKFVKGLDKAETLTQLVEAGYATYDKPDFIADYTEDAIKKFPEIKTLLLAIRERLKAEFVRGGFVWMA